MDLTIKLLFSIAVIFPVILPAQQTARSTHHEYRVGYLEYLPPDYTDSPEKFPLMIFLHGGGEVGDGTPESLDKVKSWGPPSLINQGYDMCFTVEGQKQCFVVLSPQLNPDLFDWRTTVDKLLDYVQNGPEQYKVDPDRIYLTGLSRGGFGVYEYAASYYNLVNKLAAIAPIAAWSANTLEGCIISARKIPVWAFHGKQDTVVPESLGLLAFNMIKNCPDPTPAAELIFTSYFDRFHDSWIPAYDPSNTHHSPNLYEWLLKQKRQPPDLTDPVTSVNETAKKPYSVHPNPAGDEISISLQDKTIESLHVEIRAVTGEILMVSRNPERINITMLPAGMYILRAENDRKRIITERFIKLK